MTKKQVLVSSRPNGSAAQAVGQTVPLRPTRCARTTHRCRTIPSSSKGLGHTGLDPHALSVCFGARSSISKTILKARFENKNEGVKIKFEIYPCISHSCFVCLRSNISPAACVCHRRKSSHDDFEHGSACSIARPHRRSLLYGMYGGTRDFEEGIPYNGVSVGSLLPGRV